MDLPGASAARRKMDRIASFNVQPGVRSCSAKISTSAWSRLSVLRIAWKLSVSAAAFVLSRSHRMNTQREREVVSSAAIVHSARAIASFSWSALMASMVG
ncbi:hypothetical protein N7466_010216 [Penicillium verhagenii]|uniref:uncharacterized protein n=1 Tax=Penicillium verhagenii TaxID=1562060 RepID=UPI002545178D|nr:uncharacterized protein N7466_010216 [Penicillium verhagenii]KAJ5919273.1 hypothetical protein N7466_010216 [Penicillium verhagenii]